MDNEILFHPVEEHQVQAMTHHGPALSHAAQDLG